MLCEMSFNDKLVTSPSINVKFCKTQLQAMQRIETEPLAVKAIWWRRQAPHEHTKCLESYVSLPHRPFSKTPVGIMESEAISVEL